MSLIKLASFKSFLSKRPFVFSGAAQAINDIRNGSRKSSGKVKIISEIESHLNHKNFFHRKGAEYLVNQAIDNSGNIQVDNIEQLLHKGKNIYNISSNLEKSNFEMPTTITTSVIGAGIGYSNSDDKTSGAIKGGILGAATGFGGSRGLKRLASKTKEVMKDVPKLHDEYFSNSDWHNKLTKANSKINKFIGKRINRNYITKE